MQPRNLLKAADELLAAAVVGYALSFIEVGAGDFTDMLAIQANPFKQTN